MGRNRQSGIIESIIMAGEALKNTRIRFIPDRGFALPGKHSVKHKKELIDYCLKTPNGTEYLYEIKSSVDNYSVLIVFREPIFHYIVEYPNEYKRSNRIRKR